MTSAGIETPATVEASGKLGEQILEHLQRSDLTIHREGLSQGIANASMDGGRRHLNEAPRGSIDHSFCTQVERIHMGKTPPPRRGCNSCASPTELI